MPKSIAVLISIFCITLTNCNEGGNLMSVEKRLFGELESGKSTYLYTLTNRNDMVVSISNYGGIITEIKVKDKNGKLGDVTLGYDNLEGYLEQSPYFGAIVGRYGNRICEGKFSLEGKEYQLEINNAPNHLHGGVIGFDKVLWNVQPFSNSDTLGIILKYLSKDGESGYPGNLSVEITYSLNNNDELIISYSATSDKTTLCNLTNHTYFNLKDNGKSSILQHRLKINADSYTPIDSTSITTGEILSVKGTPFDFTDLTQIGKSINSEDKQIQNGLGYDHNFVINGDAGELRHAAKVIEETTGRVMDVFTTEPGMQFYSGNFLDGSIIGKGNVVYNHRNGFCLETQHYPDSPNKPNFPSTVLKPGEVYKTTTVYKFSTVK
jgi:aldose 1-epimerase